MKKILLLVILSVFLSGCSGGGIESVGIPTNINTPTPIATIPPNILQPSVPTPTPTPSTALPASVQLKGQITDILTGAPVAEAAVNIGGKIVQTDANGNFVIDNIGINNKIIIFANNYHERADYTRDENMRSGRYDQKLVPGNFNITMFHALLDKRDIKKTVKLVKPPRFIIYMKDKEGKPVEQEIIDLIVNTIKDLPRLHPVLQSEVLFSDNIPNYKTELILDMNRTNIFISINNSIYPQYAGEASVGVNERLEVLSGSIKFATLGMGISERVIRHEILHTFGFGHPFEYIPKEDWPTFLESSVMNYLDTGFAAGDFSPADIDAMKIMMERPPGIIFPDINDSSITSSSMDKIEVIEFKD